MHQFREARVCWFPILVWVTNMTNKIEFRTLSIPLIVPISANRGTVR